MSRTERAYLFATYNGAAAVTAFLLSLPAKRVGRRVTHLLCLLGGAIDFALISQIHSPMVLLAPILPIGIACASLLTMPYTILAGLLRQRKLGIYMGLFNISWRCHSCCYGASWARSAQHHFLGNPRRTLFLRLAPW